MSRARTSVGAVLAAVLVASAACSSRVPTPGPIFAAPHIVACPKSDACDWPTEDDLTSIELYSATTGRVVRALASVSSPDLEVQPIASDFDSRWHYYAAHDDQPNAPGDAGNGLFRIPAAGGVPQPVLANLPPTANNYVVSADGSKVAYLDSQQRTTIVVAGTGNSPTRATIAEPDDDVAMQLIGWLPDDRTVVAILPNDGPASGRLVEFDAATSAPLTLRALFAAPWPTPYNATNCPDEELAGAVEGATIALAVGACAANTEPTPQVYFVDTAGHARAPVAVQSHGAGGFSVYGVQFVSAAEVVVELGRQDCYGPGVWSVVTTSGTSHDIAVDGDGCGPS